MIKLLQVTLGTFLLFSLFLSSTIADTHKNIIKERKSLFKQNYSHAKKMSSAIEKGDIDKVKNLSVKMSQNYEKLIDLFPDNSKSGYDTEALPTIWIFKDDFNNLMIESSTKAKKFTEIASTLLGAELKEEQKKLIWSSCKSCHDKFRMPH
tara:strand:+ start:614 stop:1066 length:453 start_codon:yes stop_codon:yes gene_type:complete